MFVNFVRLSPVCDRTSQPNPTETVVGWLHPCAFRKWRNKVPCACAHRSTFGRLYQRILLTCSHRAVTGNYRLYQTAKWWFRRCPTYCNNSFSANHASKSCKPWHVFIILRRRLVGCRVCTEYRGSKPLFARQCKDYICLADHHSMCVECLPQPWFVSCLPFTVMSSGIRDFLLVLCLPRTISVIGLGNSIVVVISTPQLLVPQHLPPLTCISKSLLVHATQIFLRSFLSKT